MISWSPFSKRGKWGLGIALSIVTVVLFQNCSAGDFQSVSQVSQQSSEGPQSDTPGTNPPANPEPTPEPAPAPDPVPLPDTNPDPVVEIKRRWFPGHYLYTTDDVNHLGMKDSRRNLVRTNPYFVGYQNLYWWHRVEPKKGVYDFSMILADLDKAKADGKKVIVRLMERSFHASSRPFPVPQYMVDEYNGVWYDANKIFIKIWDPTVGERFIRLIEELAKAVDGHPAFQGVFLDESSMSNIHLQSGYTHAKAADYWMRLSKRGAAAFKQGLFMMNFNWGMASNSTPTREYVTDRIVLDDGNGIGATDLRMIYTPTLKTSFGYVFDRYAGLTPMIANVEWNTYAKDVGTAKELLDFGVDRLKLNFIGWDPRTSTSGVNFNIYDAIEEINRQKGRINSAVPKNLQ